MNAVAGPKAPYRCLGLNTWKVQTAEVAVEELPSVAEPWAQIKHQICSFRNERQLHHCHLAAKEGASQRNNSEGSCQES